MEDPEVISLATHMLKKAIMDGPSSEIMLKMIVLTSGF